MEYEITPEPSPEEREALLAALERLLAGDEERADAYESAWRRAGLREGVGDDEE